MDFQGGGSPAASFLYAFLRDFMKNSVSVFKMFLNKYSSVRFIGLTQTYVSYKIYTNKCLRIGEEGMIYILFYRRKI